MNKENLKVVIRHLPPGMSEATFLQAIAPVPRHDYFYYVPGNPDRLHSFSRAYIHFYDAAELQNFAQKFDNYVFLDVKGHEYTAQVEFAPFRGITQPGKLGAGGRRRDPLQGTIDHQPEYLDFVQRLKDWESSKNKGDPIVQPVVEEKVQNSSTPLLDFVKMKKLTDKSEDKKHKKSKFQKRSKKEESFEENVKQAEESKSASSFFTTSRKFKNKKRCNHEVRSKDDSTVESVAVTRSTGEKTVVVAGDDVAAAVTRARIQTDCIRKVLGIPPMGGSGGTSSSGPVGSEQIQNIKSRRSDVKVIDKALSTHNLLPSAFKKK